MKVTEAVIYTSTDAADTTLPELILKYERIRFEKQTIPMHELLVKAKGRVNPVGGWVIEFGDKDNTTATDWRHIHTYLNTHGLFLC